MFKNYFKTAWRTILKNRIYSAINLLGLTIGLSACMLVATVVLDDLSYDKHWSRSKDLYRVVTINQMGAGLEDRFASSLTGVGSQLVETFPEVEAVADLSISDEEQFRLSPADGAGLKAVAMRADTTVWQMLDFKVRGGTPRHYVEGVGNILVTESFAKKYFSRDIALGKTMYSVPLYNDKPKEYLITGVIADIPANSVFRSEVVILQKPRKEELTRKQYGSFSRHFILTRTGTDMAGFTAKVNRWYGDAVDVKDPYQFAFQPMEDIYLHSDFAENLSVKGNFKTVFILCGVALFLMLIACVNFINLTTARTIYRMKETGVRKILGAGKSQLVMQFLVESALFFGAATVAAAVIYQVAVPFVENYLGHPLSSTLFSSLRMVAMVAGLILLLSLLTGLYPAVLLSGFKPAAALRGRLFSGSGAGQNTVRRALVVLQFSISIIVFIALLIVQQQVSFLQQKDVGFDKEGLLYTQYIHFNGKGEALKVGMLREPGVLSVSLTPWTPGSKGYMTRDVDIPDDPGKKIKVWYITGDVDMAQTMKLRLAGGRFLRAGYGLDAINEDELQQMDSLEYARTAILQSSLVTEYTARVLNLGKLNQPSQLIKNTPVGIVEDFTPESLKNDMSPTVILAEKEVAYGGMLVRAAPGFEKEVAASAFGLLRKFYPEKILDLKWVNDMLAQQYRAEERLQKLFAFFSSLSMFLAALGIFGLIMQATAQRVKEIGIRKVLGASVVSIVQLFSADYLRLILLAVVIATPIGWWLMHQWLSDYAGRITISGWVFVLAGGTAMAIALVTIALQAGKAAMSKPVKSLRNE